MILLLETIGCPVYRDLNSPWPVNTQLTDRMLPEAFFFPLAFLQSVIQVTGNNLQQDAGKTVDLRNQSAVIIVEEEELCLWRDSRITKNKPTKNPKIKYECSQLLDQHNAFVVCLSFSSLIKSFCLTP